MGDGVEDAERHAEAEQEADAAAEDELVAEKALVIREERETLPAPASVLPSSREWEATMAVAREIAGTQFVPESYRGKPDAVVAAILTGREMGIGQEEGQVLRRGDRDPVGPQRRHRGIGGYPQEPGGEQRVRFVYRLADPPHEAGVPLVL